jgi:hypothetical protein
MFRVSEKIVRVSDGLRTGVHHPQGSPLYGVVYAVEECWRSTTGQWLLIPVGFMRTFTPSGKLRGFPADAFRRVSEVGHPAIQSAATEEVVA